MAVETAIHRWDVEEAVAAEVGDTAPIPLDPRVAQAGVTEYLSEFLPGLASSASGKASAGRLTLAPADVDETWDLDLRHHSSTDSASCSVTGTISDLCCGFGTGFPIRRIACDFPVRPTLFQAGVFSPYEIYSSIGQVGGRLPPSRPKTAAVATTTITQADFSARNAERDKRSEAT